MCNSIQFWFVGIQIIWKKSFTVCFPSHKVQVWATVVLRYRFVAQKHVPYWSLLFIPDIFLYITLLAETGRPGIRNMTKRLPYFYYIRAYQRLLHQRGGVDAYLVNEHSSTPSIHPGSGVSIIEFRFNSGFDWVSPLMAVGNELVYNCIKRMCACSSSGSTE